jgi:tetratricopeptide (TPR) repeat protein
MGRVVVQFRMIVLLIVAIVAMAAETMVSGQNRPVDPATRVAELFDAGQSAHERGELEKAVGLYAEALRLDPLFWQAEYQRSLAMRSLGRLNEARHGLRRTIEQLSDFEGVEEGRMMLWRARLGLAEVEASIGDLAAAEKSYIELTRMAVGRQGLSVGWQAGQAEVSLKLGKLPEALTAVEAAINGGDNRPATMALRGVILIRLGRVSEGEKWLGESLGRDPANIFALQQRAEMMLNRRDFKAGIADLRELLRLNPQEGARIRPRLAWALAQNRENAEALRLYREILQTDPANNEVRQAVAALTIEAGESGEAVQQLDELIKAEPERADLRAQMGELLIRSQPEKALEQYLMAARLEPARISHRIGVGSALVRLRRMAEAVGVLRTALAMNPPDEVAYYAHTNLGTALYELNDFAAAIPEFLWILEHQTDEKRIPITLYFLAICLDRTGEYEEAFKIYQEFLNKATNVNQLEIDKVKLRLPIIQKQIREGKGRRKK